MMIENAGLINENIIYRSDKNFGSTTTPWNNAFQCTATSSNTIGDMIIDNCIPLNPRYGMETGKLIFTINPSTSPVTAQWTVKNMSGMRLSDRSGFTIPTNLILTKK